MQEVDFGRSAHDYRRYRAGFPPDLFTELRHHGIGRAGQRVVDLGTGTGTVARQMALAGCEVTGIDKSDALIEQARALDDEAGVKVDYCIARAEATGLPAGEYDVVIAGQCWHWFDPARATAEARRLLARAGVLVLAHFDWIPLPGNVVAVTEALIEQHNPQWKLGGMNGMHPRYAAPLSEGGFTGLRSFSFDVDVPYTHEAWRGRVRASAGVGASLPPDKVQAFDAALEQALRREFPQDPFKVFHRVWALWGYVG